MNFLNYFSILLVTSLLQNCRSQDYTLVVFNDIKGQLQPYRNGTIDKPVECPATQESNCVGGLPKVVHHINKIRNESPQSTYVLSPGNLVGGESGWLSIIGWKRYGEIVKDHYKPNAMSLGMNEFGAGLDRTLDYLYTIHNITNGTVVNNPLPIVLSNVICDGVTTGSEGKFCQYSQLNRGVHQLVANSIGLLGFINPDVTKLSSPGNLKFKEVIPALKEALAQNNGQYSTYIAMGDGSLDLAKQILAEIPQIKVVIYGRSFGSSKNMLGNFPEKYGNDGYIATAGNYGSSVGKLRIALSGTVVNTAGSRLDVTEDVVTEGDVLNTYNKIYGEVATKTAVIGSSHFRLVGGESCWRQECNLGNLVTDAMVHCLLSKAHMDSNTFIPSNEPIFSLWHSGALFKDIIQPDDNITTLDIHKWLPFHNRVFYVTILGSDLLKVFGASAEGITANKNPNVKDWGQFLQVSSGMEVSYSTSGGDPIIRLLHTDGMRPEMQPLIPTKNYHFVIPSFIMEGRNVYEFAKAYWKPVLQNSFDFDDSCVEGYVTALKRVATGFEERIWIDNGPTSCDTYSKGTYTAVTVVVTMVVTLILVGVIYAAYFYVVPSITGRRPDGFNNF